jgi:tRNA (uracil-5-)-methyltransferase TRM9
LTRSFYEGSALGFCAANELPSSGWGQVLDLLQPALASLPALSVLDVGCGNGRFFRCLAQQLERPFTYLGLDSSQQLVALARARSAESASFQVMDFVDGDLNEQLGNRRFELVAAFGVLHHIPGRQRRRRFLEALCRLVHPGGALALSTWRKSSDEQLRRKVVDWPEFNRQINEPFDLAQIEAGDHLVHKPGQGVRYCHFVEKSEAQDLLADLPLSLLADFTADGRAGHRNHYFVLTNSRQT